MTSAEASSEDGGGALRSSPISLLGVVLPESAIPSLLDSSLSEGAGAAAALSAASAALSASLAALAAARASED